MIGDDFAGEEDRVERVLIKDWWYDVLPGTFRGTGSDGFDYPEYVFDYRPRNRRFNEPPSTMHVRSELIDAVQLLAPQARR